MLVRENTRRPKAPSVLLCAPFFQRKIPDRTTADYEISKLRDQLGARLLKAAIRKDRPGKRSTYTLRYFTRDTDQVSLF